MNILVRASIAGALLGATVGAGAWVEERTLPTDRVLPGVRVGGEVVPDDVAHADDADVAEWILQREAPLLDRSIEVHTAVSTRTVKLRDLVKPIDVQTIARRVRAFGHDGSLANRLDEAMRARRGEIDVPVVVEPDVEAIEHLVGALKSETDRPPVDAKLSLADKATIPDVPGAFVDFDGAVVMLEEDLRAHALQPADPTSLEIPTLAVRAKVTAEELASIDIRVVVGEWETHFGRNGDQAPRATNIEIGAKKLDGLVMQPGQLVSFNEVVGERSEASGFKLAWEIFKGEMRPGVGGGTCQVASTLHAAAFFAGLDVLERMPHSRPSAYIPMGLDSTVVYPSTDLKLKNPWDFPVVVHTKVGQNTIKIEILGKEKPVSVAFARDTLAVLPYERRIDEEPNVAEGKAIKKQGGIRGYRIRRIRKLTPLVHPLPFVAGAVDWSEPKIEESLDYYPPTIEIYVVAPGADPAMLPAMPQDVLEALTKKAGLPPEYSAPPTSDAVACAGDCDPNAPPPPKLEVKNAAGVHENTGDQVAPAPKVILQQ